jgi:predicted ArsR family transcriptional regulator
MSIIAIADELVVHPNTARFHLESLGSDGLVELVEPDRKGPGRPPLMFRAVRQMDRGGTRHYQLLAEILTMHLSANRRPGDKALAAGRAWGRSLASLESELESPPAIADADEAVDRLIDVLDELGFAPERGESNGEQSNGEQGAERQIGLRHCSFLELAERGSNVVCPVHLGLVQGALEAWEAPVSAERLDAFVEPDLCLLHVKPTGTDK